MTDGQDAAEQIRRADHRLEVLSGATQAFAEATADYDRLVVVIAENLAALLKNTCVVQILSEDGSTLVPVAIAASDPAIVDRVRTLLATDPIRVDGHALYRQVLETGEPLLVPKIDAAAFRAQVSEQHEGISASLGMHSGLMVALRVQGRSLGALSMGRYEPELPSFDAHDRDLACTMAVHAALAITNARLFQSVRRELAERRQTEDALQRSEEQLRHAQKMEAVGRLAGGVAHDFNNLLSVVLGYTTLILAELPAGDPLRLDLEEVRKAGERAEQLTRQLLAFSRRQVLEARRLDLDVVVAGIETMLRRVVGASVDLTILTAAQPAMVRADPTGLEQVLMNLVVNARDAMPEGGRLTIETDHVELDGDYAMAHPEVTPGPYVMLAVSDTGTGMDLATQARIFEPFFTTKDKDKGTGLGLSTAFGIVKQSGGHIWVYSEPRVGTTFKVYLPRAEGPVETVPTRPPTLESLRGTETLLLVEDDDQVRAVARGILRRYGYRVLEASNGGEALLICEQHPATIHLLVSDVVLPRLSGRDLAKRLATTRLGMKVLFMSGYADEAIFQHGILESDALYVQKPFTPERLARGVRQALGRP